MNKGLKMNTDLIASIIGFLAGFFSYLATIPQGDYLNWKSILLGIALWALGYFTNKNITTKSLQADTVTSMPIIPQVERTTMNTDNDKLSN